MTEQINQVVDNIRKFSETVKKASKVTNYISKIVDHIASAFSAFPKYESEGKSGDVHEQ